MGARRSTGTRGPSPSRLPTHVHTYPRQAAPPMVTLPAPASYSAFASMATTTTGTTTLRQAHPAPFGCSHLVSPNVSSFGWPLRLKSCTATITRHTLLPEGSIVDPSTSAWRASVPLCTQQVFRFRACKLRAFSLVRVIWLTHQRIWLRADRLRGLGVAPTQARLRADRLHVSCLFDGHPKSVPFVSGDDCNIGLARGRCPWACICTR
ncbi:hypothetical protein BC826DRAFT_1069026 [Russula brevipes]|nr:hypothetical protein BC826DRAFT_1069026 [Russula brevipes]